MNPMAEFEADSGGTMDSVIEQIYKSCDPDGTDLVTVSVLMEFVKQFMPENLEEADNLYRELDPGNENPNVSRRRFSIAMQNWVSHMNEQHSKEQKSPITTPYHERETLAPECDYFIEDSQFISEVTVSPSSEVTNANPSLECGMQETVLAETIKELHYQIQKLKNDHSITKQQLAATEEQNEYLQTDLDNLKRTHKCEQSALKEQLKDTKQENERHAHECAALKKRLAHAEKESAALRKRVQSLECTNDALEKERTQLRTRLEMATRCEHNVRAEWEALRAEAAERAAETAELRRVAAELRTQLGAQRDLVAFYASRERLPSPTAADATGAELGALAAEGGGCSLMEEMLEVGVQGKSKRHCGTTSDIDEAITKSVPSLSPSDKTVISDCAKSCSAVVLQESGKDSTLPVNAIGRSMVVEDGASGDICSEKGTTEQSVKQKVAIENVSTLTQTYLQETTSVIELKELLREQQQIKQNLSDGITQLRHEVADYKLSYDEIVERLRAKDCEVYDWKLKYEQLTEEMREERQGEEKSLENRNVQTVESGDCVAKICEQMAGLQAEKKFHSNVKKNLEKLWAENTATIGTGERLVLGLIEKLNRFVNVQQMDESCELLRTLAHLSKIVDAIVAQLKLYESKKNSFTKQQSKIDRLLDRIEKLNSDLEREKKHSLTLSEKCKRDEEEALKRYEDKTEELNGVIRKLRTKCRTYNADMLQLKRDLDSMEKEIGVYQANYQEVMSITEKLKQEIQCLLRAKEQLETDLEMRSKNDLENQRKIEQLQSELRQKRCCSKGCVNVDNVTSFLSAGNTDLKNATSTILERVRSKLPEESVELLKLLEKEMEKNSPRLEDEMNNLGNNIKLAMKLLETMAEKCNFLWPKETEESTSSDAWLTIYTPTKSKSDSVPTTDSATDLDTCFIRPPRITESERRLIEKSLERNILFRSRKIPRRTSTMYMKSSFYTTLNSCVKVLMFLVLVLVFLFGYIQWECTKNENIRDCPLDSILHMIIQKRPARIL